MVDRVTPQHGGIGGGISPKAALAVGLKVDSEALPASLVDQIKVLTSWGPEKYDAELDKDGKAFRPDGKSAATLLPPAF